MVMYLGKVVEQGAKGALFAQPAHPYTRALMASTPSLSASGSRTTAPRAALRGELPSPLNPPPGCRFHRRCPYVIDRCRHEVPVLRDVAQTVVACHRAEDVLAGARPTTGS
jgi:dipeptide transport system ATP-binding protein